MTSPPENLPARSVHPGHDAEAAAPQATLPLRSLTWVLLVFFMGSVLFADLLHPGDRDQGFGLSLASFLIGAKGTEEMPPSLEYGRVWSSRIGATIPARAWMNLFATEDGVRLDSARIAIALWGSGFFVAALLVLLAGTRDPLVPCLVFASILWLRAWQHIPDGPRIAYHYAWDFPALLVFSVVLVLMQRRKEKFALAVAALAVSVKLTSGVWLLAIPWIRRWTWRRRLAILGLAGASCLVVKLGCDLIAGNRLLFTANTVNAEGSGRLIEQLALLVRPSFDQPLFIGGGLVIGVLLCAGRRHLGLIAVMAGFIAGELLFAEPGEYRVFIEIMPVCALVVSERARTLRATAAD
jgi:hypothetical protein